MTVKLFDLQCPHCDAADTLERVETRTEVTIIAVCTCCAKSVTIKNNKIEPDVRDTQGNGMYG
jgi:hypothetical protein